MRTARIWVVAITAAAFLQAGNSWAQPTEDEEEETSGPEAVDEETPATLSAEPDPEPPRPRADPPARRSPALRPATRPTVPSVADTSADGRPLGLSVGIGVGYAMPADIDQPNVASVRFRLPSGLTLEPQVELDTTAQTVDVGGDETKDAVNRIALITDVRYPFRSRGAFDFVLRGGALLQRTSQDPDGSDNNQTDSLMGLTYGISVDYWLSQHWALSFNATNPIIAYSSTTQEIPGADDSKSSTTMVGAIFDPFYTVTIHLFY